MKKFLKYSWTFCKIIIPFLLIIGFSRILILSQNDFLPSATEIYDKLLQMPNFALEFNNNFKTTQEAFNGLSIAFSNVTDFGSFFGAIGSFFGAIGVAIQQLFNTIVVVVNSLIWFVGFLLGFN